MLITCDVFEKRVTGFIRPRPKYGKFGSEVIITRKKKIYRWVVQPSIVFDDIGAKYLRRELCDSVDRGTMPPSPEFMLVEKMKKFCQDRGFQYHLYDASYTRFSFKEKKDAIFFALAFSGTRI